MIIFIYGSDTYRSRQYRDKIVTKFQTEKDPGGYNIVNIDGENAPVGQITQEVCSAPFLSEKRMVVVKNTLSGKVNKALDELETLISEKKVPESTVLVIWERTEEFKNKTAQGIVKLLQAEKFKEHFPTLGVNEAVGWAKQQLTAFGLSAGPGAVESLVAGAGTDSFVIEQLLLQLKAYKPGGTITTADVAQFVEAPADDNIFALVEHFVRGNAKAALSMMRAQYKNGEDENFILLMLIRQARMMLLVADGFTRNESPDIMAKKLGLHPFAIKKTVPLVRQFTRKQLEDFFLALSDFDQRMKTGRGDLGVMLDTLVAKLAIR
ncbi:MAG: DNA polymerase III subunit delta [Candidatus Magasanikbacteria bacterium]|nr:DNA polymerase III subunit delta [Candidatus Magasanikbacteria bacterium]